MTPVIDFHTHIFPDAIAATALDKLARASHTLPFTDGTASGLTGSMRRAGIWRSVVLPVATSPRQVIHINDTSLRINEETGTTGLLSFGCMHPDFGDWHAELGRIAAAGIRGIKLHPVYQGVPFDDPRYVRILARAGELGLTVVIHAGLDIGFPGAEQSMPRLVQRALRGAGPVRLVLAHMGGWRCWEEAADLLAGCGVWVDTAFSLGRLTPLGDGHTWTEPDLQMLTPESFVSLVRRWGADRVLFGTDSPWADQAEEEKPAILGRSAADLLELDLPG